MFQQTKALCQQFLQMGVPSFDLIIYKDGECVLRYMGGYADADKTIPIQGKEKYRIYSCSKLITCVAAMQLWEKGMFSLEDNLADYMPAFRDMSVKTEEGIRKATKPIKIQDLFQMTSGMNYNRNTPALQEYTSIPNNPCPTVEMVNLMAQTPLAFEPGEGWKYSLSHDVLAALVEILSGEKFAEYVKRHIFDPLGMENSTYQFCAEDGEDFAQQYRYDSNTGRYLPTTGNDYGFGMEYASGGAGCISTVDDYIKFLEALRIGNVILKKETIALMSTNRLTETQCAMFAGAKKGMGYGLGMRTPWQDSTRTEFGWGGAAGAYASVDPVNNMTIFYVQHVLASPNRSLREWVYRSARADLRGEKIQVPGVDLTYAFTY
ncbi:MAG: beta-lactamase family protein [Oscillospiraceae bacterium]|nr:beta-lactamase family protein [Oscillospiraceae bacterium]